MKPFDLTKAVSGAEVETRKGRKVTELRIFITASEGEGPIAGVVEGKIHSWFRDGRYYPDQESDFDLCMKPNRKTGWVNVYPTTLKYRTRYDADKEANPERIACVEITWEE